MSVSGTYCPPYGPNLAVIISAPYSLHECPDPVDVLHTDRRLDTAAHVHPVGPERAHDLAHVAGVEPTGEEHVAPVRERPRRGPVPGAAGAAAQVRRPRVE